MKIILLGTGSNGGSPQIDESSNTFRKQKRLRSSVLIKSGRNNILIDAGPDMRQQLIRQNLSLEDLDLVIISHMHWDHTLGLMEFSAHRELQIPVTCAPKLKNDLLNHQLFGFLFKAKFAKFVKTTKGVKVEFIEIPHSNVFPTFAIKLTIDGKTIINCSDIESIPNSLAKEIKNADLIIFGGTFLNQRVAGHIPIVESGPILAKLTKNVVFTHINHSEKKEDIEKFLKPFGFRAGFDGMEVKL